MLYIIDHNDSFTHNLAAQIRKFVREVCVIQASDIDSVNWDDKHVEGIVLSPGPKAPQDYERTLAVVDQMYQKVPIIGVCLGHQMIGHYFGARIKRGEKPIQGYVHEIELRQDVPFLSDLKSPLLMTRYHSLHVCDLPDVLVPLGWSTDGVIQMMRHCKYPIFSVQFHPESCGSRDGEALMYRMLKEAKLCHL